MHSTKISANLKRSIGTYVFVIIWATLSLGGVFWLMQSGTRLFDAEEKILEQFPSVDRYLAALNQELEPYLTGVDAPALVRITQAGCACNMGSAGHWGGLNKRYPDYRFLQLDVTELPEPLAVLVPSTPMAIYVNEKGMVRYAGPFNDALYCNRKNSLIEAYLGGATDRPFAPLATEGCYCPVDLS